MRRVILGTDWWTDCDDVAALRICARADKRGLWQLMGVCIDACTPEPDDAACASVNAFLTAEGLCDIPIGIDHSATTYPGPNSYQPVLAARYPHAIASNDECPDALSLYKTLLRDCADGEAEILEIGFQQTLAALLNDPEGYTLFRDKVARLWLMAGSFAENGRGREYNCSVDKKASRAAHIVAEKAPCPVTYLGFEVGVNVLCGGNPENDPLLAQDPLVCAFDAHGSHNGRCSWDPMLALLALHGDAEKAGYTCRYGRAAIDPENGENTFAYGTAACFTAQTPHRYVVKNRSDAAFQTELNHWLRDA